MWDQMGYKPVGNGPTSICHWPYSMLKRATLTSSYHTQTRWVADCSRIIFRPLMSWLFKYRCRYTITIQYNSNCYTALLFQLWGADVMLLVLNSSSFDKPEYLLCKSLYICFPIPWEQHWTVQSLWNNGHNRNCRSCDTQEKRQL